MMMVVERKATSESVGCDEATSQGGRMNDSRTKLLEEKFGVLDKASDQKTVLKLELERASRSISDERNTTVRSFASSANMLRARAKERRKQRKQTPSFVSSLAPISE
mmetsp:Transcript_7304/g.15620  ORF Transcript_7304/g.15620 Transcript_7304/m.15620 type:complete len:107 (+) Transcript_7304:127-447(+)